MIITVAVTVCALLPQAGGQAADPPSARWEPNIAKFEQADREQPPPAGAILFTGSSTVVRWHTLDEDFSFAPVLNRGFGGSQVSDLLVYLDRVVIAYEPRMVVVYSGDNDLNAGKSAEQVLADYRAMQERVHEALPETLIVIIGPKFSPRRWHLADEFREVNTGLLEWAAQTDRLDCFDLNDLMLGEDGLPREELYSDGLHFTAECYALWAAYLRPLLRERWEQLTAGEEG